MTSGRLASLSFAIALSIAARVHAGDGEAFFEREIRPLLVAECQKCHGPTKQHAGLRLDSRDALLKGGDSGPTITPGDPNGSLLLKAVRHEDGHEMPPEGKLAPAKIDALASWIENGAPWPAGEQIVAGLRSGPPTDEERKFWSFRPIVEPPVPAVRDEAWPTNEIDRFVLARLEREGLRPGPDADARTLLRRVTFDLTGLPPTPAEIADFLADESPDAYAKVVERLLASPAHGERWGRHWLDVVRYADTAGDGADYPVREAHRYRDYVVASFSADKPFDRFVREQIAGDVEAKARAAEGSITPEEYAEKVVATGYLAIGKRYGYDLKPAFRHLDLADVIDNLGPTFLGLSIGCARCHDHKFDPLTAADYYALYGVLESTALAFPGGEELKRPKNFAPLALPAEVARLDAERAATLAALDEEIKSLEAESGSPAEAAEAEARKQRLAELKSRRTRLADEPPYPVAYGASEGTPTDVPLQKRGEPDKPGEIVPRRFLELLGGDPLADPKSSGRRELAEWLTRPSNPLTARVWVNRVWRWHFGRGIVATPNDFGTRGDAPTHPELLDFLAARFVANGWSTKRLHRDIVLSRAYRQSSVGDAESLAKDPDGVWLSRFRRRPLDAEEIRDAMLAASGTLVAGSPGPHPFPDVHSWGFTIHEPFQAVYESDRRSVYLMVQRSRRHPFLGIFDGADASASTPDRRPTITPQQALFLMNGELAHTQSDALAGRLLRAAGDDEARLRLAYELTTGGPPDDATARASREFVNGYREKTDERRAWAALARTLFASNGFLFVD